MMRGERNVGEKREIWRSGVWGEGDLENWSFA
jgi:hypothetical protein